ncbi:ABC transporter ATP-binding protein [Defluviitalea raffinosedens]|jgi:iron complex transport system ATP-binding protein|uniref:ABC transporter ATP-binding protein n=1 Tax=Defluviitalea raffinosedens TaxID=1450156 RepID=UPI00195CED9A|nr:ABC transporter ATP-binding protein [Defluviitalea raffinosedens]MBM7687217.1 iron complex transport system ATP-binding protein [Defluviitalea raffinosedens]HQD51348.1 ABC transporter ATP-binding protein [Defluviitaleaceae bacterium]
MIKLKNITAGYNNVEVIKNINIAFEEASITTIIGKNGCGKTTLLKTAANILKAFKGEVILKDRNISSFSNKELAKKLSFLPQIRKVPNITVYNLVMHGRYPYLDFLRVPQQKDKEIVQKTIEDMALGKYINKNIYELSGGQRQKVYIAMLLAQDTDIIFLDEPTTYLDINHQLEILEIIKRLKKMGKTIVMVLHDLNNALSYSDKICLMDKGEIVIYDSPEKVFESREIDRVFKVYSSQITFEDEMPKQYLFNLK